MVVRPLEVPLDGAATSHALPFAEPEQAPPNLPPKGQLLKWIGSKQRFAAAIVATFPKDIATYYEPFIGSAAVLATLAPQRAVASDALAPLIDLWSAVAERPEQVVAWYSERWQTMMDGEKVNVYKELRDRYNRAPNAADLLFLTRSCYGGVIRFSKIGAMNTPCGIHRPIAPAEFARRAAAWHERLANTRFVHSDFEAMIDGAAAGDLIYCDPPYSDSESTLYGAQKFTLVRLLDAIDRAKGRGVRVVLSIDGSKRSGQRVCDVPIPHGLFATEHAVTVGRSMLRRFQLPGQTLEHEVVADRLLLTWTA